MPKRTDYKADAKARRDLAHASRTTLPIAKYADGCISPEYAAGLGAAISRQFERTPPAETGPIRSHSSAFYGELDVTWMDEHATGLLRAAAHRAHYSGIAADRFDVPFDVLLVLERGMNLPGLDGTAFGIVWSTNPGKRRELHIEAWGVPTAPTPEKPFTRLHASIDNEPLSFLLAAVSAVATSARVRRVDQSGHGGSRRIAGTNVRQLSMTPVRTDTGMDPELLAALGQAPARDGVPLRWIPGRWIERREAGTGRLVRIWIDGFVRTDA